MEIMIDRVNKSDAKKIAKWYNANTNFYHFVRPMRIGKMYEVYRQI